METGAEAVAVGFAEFGQPGASLFEGFFGGAFGHQDYVLGWGFQGIDDLLGFGQVGLFGYDELQLVRVVGRQVAEGFGVEAEAFVLVSERAVGGRVGELGADAHEVAFAPFFDKSGGDCPGGLEGDVFALFPVTL